MKTIIIQDGLSANHFIRQSLLNGFKLAGYNTYFWNPEGKSAFDLFGEIPQIDLFLGSTWQLDRAIIKCLLVKPEIPVILYGDIWGDIQTSLDLNIYPVGIATDEQKRNTEQLCKGRNNVHIISNHGYNWVDSTHGNWKNLTPSVSSLLVSADITQYYQRPSDDNYKVQLAYCGGYWDYKAGNIDKYLFPLLFPNTNWRIRLFGGGWNICQALGNISNEEAARHYSNAQIIPHLVEPHCSDIYQDLPLRYFEVAACQGFALSCPVVDIRSIFDENELVVADNPKDFREKIVYWLNHYEESIPYRQKAYQKIMSAHTNLHRVLQLAKLIDIPTKSIESKLNELQINQA